METKTTEDKRANVLVVEDEVIVAMNIEANLENSGYQVAGTATTGQEAIELALTHKPDLVLMDIRLEGEMDGITAAQTIFKAQQIPIIFLTAYSDQATLKRARETLPYGYILKPFDIASLQPAIEMALYKHKMEQKLKLTEMRYRAVVEDQSEFICRIKPNGEITFVNEAYCQYFNTTAQKLLGTTNPPRLPAEHIERVRNHFSNLTPQKPAGIIEFPVLMPQKGKVWQQWVNRAIFDQNQHLIEYQLVGRDITQRVNAEQNLKNSEQKHRIISELLPDYVYSAEVKTDGSIQLTWISGAIKQITGYTTDEIEKLPSGLGSICLDNDEEKVKNVFEQLNRNQTTTHRYRIKTKYGEIKWLEETIRPVLKQNMLTMLYGAVKDISTVVNLEENNKVLEQVLLKAPYPTVIFSKELNPLLLNHAAKQTIAIDGKLTNNWQKTIAQILKNNRESTSEISENHTLNNKKVVIKIHRLSMWADNNHGYVAFFISEKN